MPGHFSAHVVVDARTICLPPCLPAMFLLFLCRAAAALALSQWDFIEILSGIDMYAMRLELRVIKIIVSITPFCSSAIPQPHLKLPTHFHCCVGGWVGGT